MDAASEFYTAEGSSTRMRRYRLPVVCAECDVAVSPWQLGFDDVDRRASTRAGLTFGQGQFLRTAKVRAVEAYAMTTRVQVSDTLALGSPEGIIRRKE